VNDSHPDREGVPLINLWAEKNVTSEHVSHATNAANILTNQENEDAFTPQGTESRPSSMASWLEEECLAHGQLPFDYTCSNRINVLILSCGFVNAFVTFVDSLENFPYPAGPPTSSRPSSTNNDNIFYLCTEYLDVHPNPADVANTVCLMISFLACY
jgi:hypothetical protein